MMHLLLCRTENHHMPMNAASEEARSRQVLGTEKPYDDSIPKGVPKLARMTLHS
jgi:hypothetical protein